MPELRVADLVEATGGTLVRGAGETVLRSFAIDTRRLEPGAAFFALRGDRRDGHRFLGDAARRGAVAAVIDAEPGDEAPEGLIRVDDTTAALARCGRWVRDRMASDDRIWIAVTGSNGKTTTKELIAAGLGAQRRVYSTPGNFNNHLGVPLTLLACPEDCDAVVLEIAMSAAGEIAALTRLTSPTIGLITNVRAVHLRSFTGLDDIAAAKGELFALLADDAVSVVNLDDAHVRVQSTRHRGPRVTFGRHPAADLRMDEIVDRFVPGAAFAYVYEGVRRTVELRIGGAHAAWDALAALAVVAAAGGDLDAAAEGMRTLEAGPGRGKVHRLANGVLLVDDSYNSSPSAMASVLDTLRASHPAGRRVLVMGDMLELGPLEGAMHREAGKRAAAAGVELLIAVGPQSRGAAESGRRAGVPEVHHHGDASRAAESVAEFLRPGDLVLVKGSRGMHMERIVAALLAGQEAAS